MNAFELKRVVEAVLFVSDKPLTVKEIWQKLFLMPNTEAENSQAPDSARTAVPPVDPSAGAAEAGTQGERAPKGLATEGLLDEQDNLGGLENLGEHDSGFVCEVSKDDIYRVLCELQADYADRGCQLKEVASGYRFQVSEDMAMWLQRWRSEKPPRYSRAVLETLAIIAYKQPITRAEIEDIRGVAVSSHIVKGLLEREWVRIVGHKEVPGRPALLATTRSFLDYFNVISLDQLPTLAEIKELGERKRPLEDDEPPRQATRDQSTHEHSAGSPAGLEAGAIGAEPQGDAGNQTSIVPDQAVDEPEVLVDEPKALLPEASEGDDVTEVDGASEQNLNLTSDDEPLQDNVDALEENQDGLDDQPEPRQSSVFATPYASSLFEGHEQASGGLVNEITTDRSVDAETEDAPSEADSLIKNAVEYE